MYYKVNIVKIRFLRQRADCCIEKEMRLAAKDIGGALFKVHYLEGRGFAKPETFKRD